MNQETAVFTVGVFTIIAASMMGLATAVITAIISVLALFLMVPAHHIRRVFGYGFTVDISFGVLVSMMAVGTLGGFQAAVVAGLISTLARLEMTHIWGAEQLAINGKTGLGIFKELGRWVVRRTSLRFEWVETAAAGGFAASNIGKLTSFLAGSASKPSKSWVMPSLLVGSGVVIGAVAAPMVLLSGVAAAGVLTTWTVISSNRRMAVTA
jgi:hypothetical protein